MDGMPGDNPEIDVVGVPLFNRSFEETSFSLDEITGQYDRVWLLISGTHPFMDPDGVVRQWLEGDLYLVQENSYFGHSDLNADQYLREVPVYTEVPETLKNPAEIVFGDQLRLHGFSIGPLPETEVALPYTLYWEAVQPTERRYKYAMRLVELSDDGSSEIVSTAEREPYTGAIPTIYWDPGKIIVEYGELPPVNWQRVRTDALADPERFALTLEVYDAETLEKLPVVSSGDLPTSDDGASVILPFEVH